MKKSSHKTAPIRNEAGEEGRICPKQKNIYFILQE
jgi:hypothetical protein